MTMKTESVTNVSPTAGKGFGEFVALMAMMMSLTALATDAMLPALDVIGADLGVTRANETQMVVSLLFLGMAVGQIFYGPLSDSFGRKPAIYAGYALFIVGCLLSIFAGAFQMMLIGRLLQGLGAAAPRSVSVALIRDQYEGRLMAKVMSFIMVIFILVPIIAPTMGQVMLMVADWRFIFVVFLLLALTTVIWFALRQRETLPPDRRLPFSAGRILAAFREVLTNRVALGYTVAAGLISGGFLGYLNSAQQVFQVQYGLGARFPLYFAGLALALGVASYMNGRLVMRYGMRLLSTWSSWTLGGLSLLFLAFAWLQAGHPPLWIFTVYMLISFFCIGVLFGNLNALAMEPLGHIAGVGAAVVGALSLLIATLLGMFIGQSYNGTILPLVTGFAVLALLAVAVMRWAGSNL
jgi:DHA1 family bicyclomycin/chloramphenicol resistance-like MFS transporter